MEELRACKRCGTLFNSIRATHEYCSKICSANDYYHRRLANEQPIPEEFRCPNNDAVICGEHKCGSCGWNPMVAK